MRDSGRSIIINGILTLANTEYKQALPLNCHKFSIKSRGNEVLKLSFVAGESGTNYLTIPTAISYWEDNLRVNTNIYVQSPVAGTIMEIVAWSGGDDL